MQGSLDKIVDKVLKGGVHVVFRPLDVQLHGYYSKESLTLPMTGRRGRSIGLGVLEVVVESNSTSIDWRLKLNGISVTREFKPHYTVKYRDKIVSKFVYDVTSFLNVEESRERDWVNLTVKYEGGEAFKLKKIQLISLYEEQYSTTDLRYQTGILLLNPGEAFPLSDLSSRVPDAGVSELRVAGYVTKTSCRLSVAVDGVKHEFAGSSVEGFEEFVIPGALGSSGSIASIMNEGVDGAVIISSILQYASLMSIPRLEVEDVSVKRLGEGLTVNVSLVNKGEAPPDYIIYVVMDRGSILASHRVHIPLKPGEVFSKEIVIPRVPNSLRGVTVRIIWGRLARVWMTERSVDLN
ncbi:MAG: hypothetical protein OWQ48_02040 [Desulfurococcus sp.]|nr:hypothetical protein [Desulfurococcus sp.]